MADKHQTHVQSEELNSNHSSSQPSSEYPSSNKDLSGDLTGVQKHFSPGRFLLITIGGIFLAEIVAMAFLLFFTDLPYFIQTIIDASLMVVLIFPIIYFFSLRPLILHIRERQRAETALRQSEKRFSKAFHSSPGAQSITRITDGSFIDVNESFLHLFGYKREEVIGRTVTELGIYASPTQRADLVQRLSANEEARELEIDGRTRSGEIRNVLVSAEAIELDNETEICILATILDITERKLSEAHLHRLNRALQVLNHCNQWLIRSNTEAELLSKMCEIIVNVGKYRLAWIGLAELDQSKSVRPIAQCGFEDGYLSLAQISWADTERGRGPTGTAIRTGTTQVNQDFLINPHTTPWRQAALQRGYQSSIALPIKVNNSIFGALTIYSSASDAFDPEEVCLLTELVDDLAFGITALREHAERQKADEQVRELALFPTLNPDAVLRVDSNGRIEKVNPAASQIGFSVGAQLTDHIPELGTLNLYSIIASGVIHQLQQNLKAGEASLLWTLRGVPDLGVAFLYGKNISELKRAEARISLLSSIVEQTDDTVVVTNREGVIEYVNPSFERLTGFTRDEALEKTPRIIKSGAYADDFYKNLWNTILEGKVFHSEIANCKKNGDVYYEMKTITPLRNEQGQITHFVATGKDITERKRAEEELLQAYDELELRIQERTVALRTANALLEEEIAERKRAESALRENEERLNRAQEIAHLGSWGLDLVHDQLTWSDEVYRIFGLQPQEFGATYEAFLAAVHPDDRVAVDEAYSGSIREGKDSYEIEHRVVRRSNGEIRFVHEKCEHFRNEAGKIICSIGMVHDITERRQAEEALRIARDELEQRVTELQTLMDVAPVGIAIGHDPDGKVITVNQLLSAWLNAPEGSNVSLSTPDEERQVTYQVLHKGHPVPVEELPVQKAALKSQGVRNDEFSLVRSDGRTIEMLANAEPLFDNDGRVRGSIATYIDITERKRAEEELQAARDKLEQRVQERTVELALANAELLKEIAERKEVERQLRVQTTAMEAAANGIVITDPQGNIQWVNPALAHMSGYTADELLDNSTHIFSSGQHDQDFYQQMWGTILAGKVWRGETTNRRKDGSLYVEEQTITPVQDEKGNIPHFIAIKQDITQRKRAEAELERRNLELQVISNAEHEQRQFAEALVKAALVLSHSLSLEEVLPHILEQIQEVIPYQFANITLLDGETFYAASQRGAESLPAPLKNGINHRHPLENFPLLKKMRQEACPLLLPDLRQTPDWVSLENLGWSQSFLSAPLLVEGRVIGFTNLFAAQPGFFTEAMCQRLAAFAVHAAVAIQNAWLFEQIQASSERLQSLSRRLVEIQENERQYIARELHDEAGQILTSLMLDLRLLEKNIYQPQAILDKIAEMEKALKEVFENLHNVAMSLRPATLDHLGLVSALRQYVKSIAIKHGIKVSFQVGKIQARLNREVETVLYRIVQEALTNVIRHARATQTDVILTVRGDKLIVIVEDNGVGFNPKTVSSDEHLGLLGMRERAEMINGKLIVESAPRRGTTVMVEVEYVDSIADRG